jgi:hypothetical protein
LIIGVTAKLLKAKLAASPQLFTFMVARQNILCEAFAIVDIHSVAAIVLPENDVDTHRHFFVSAAATKNGVVNGHQSIQKYSDTKSLSPIFKTTMITSSLLFKLSINVLLVHKILGLMLGLNSSGAVFMTNWRP